MKNKKAKHTPGPWIASPENYEETSITDVDGRLVATVCCAGYDVSDDSVISMEEGKLNAALVVAAPGLLDACKVVLASIQVSRLQQFRPEAEVLASAIATAEGK